MTATRARTSGPRMRARLQQPIDGASLAAFRIGFGALLTVAALRYFAHGWIAEYFLEPRHFFKYWGLGWVRPLPAPLMYAHFALMVLCGLCVCLGLRPRLASAAYGSLFGYAHLIDKTNYLNHYYLVVCLCALSSLLPASGVWSLDARLRGDRRRAEVPIWALWCLRAQVGLVYAFGGLAKLNQDWLVRGEPLATWLGRASESVPGLGFLAEHWVALGASWAGAAFDLSVVPLLLWRRSRMLAFAAVVTFHFLTSRWFSIGLFPYFMVNGALLFFAPDWPRRVLGWLGARRIAAREMPGTAELWRFSAGGAPRFAAALLVLHFSLQLVLPLRHFLYPGQLCWTEQGFRFSWNVMLMEKNGSVDFRVEEPLSGRRFRVAATDYFTPYQAAMMAPQPDMVLEAAHIIAQELEAHGARAPRVYADAFASLNGRPMQRLIDPEVDLARQVDGLGNKPWIVPLAVAVRE